ncbi:hypothetical protein H7J07_09505 [Mycobacterium koreense]|uniref:Uncharacterized protein n=1 Tax=Mycolicibacillus koreensis TaxID=1069220 RepID=A0A7I7SF42_9MYCO|nr:hypothetical protein [Mycolicibacillus koreensis]MCV7248452.1 hypothetical protein [Mycolicibacillus koreensis]OSC26951.1 hypothetical protein B8W67_18285 [Mycolicibacillus koreensis]BBY55398.1 hypothetical protein MKOR_26490 [Mycolicibacillus koreensis]
MRHRGWILAGAALAVTVIVVAVLGVGKARRPQAPPVAALPTCDQVYAWPGVQDAVVTAFADTWPFHERDEPEQRTVTNCSINASFPVFDWDARPAGTPHSRLLIVLVEAIPPDADPDWDRHACDETPTTSEPVDEPGLGEEAYGCWAADDFGGYQYLHRYLHVRTGGLGLLLSLSGADYGPLDDPAVTAGLRADLERNARCIIEPVVNGLGGEVDHHGQCGDVGRDV